MDHGEMVRRAAVEATESYRPKPGEPSRLAVSVAAAAFGNMILAVETDAEERTAMEKEAPTRVPDVDDRDADTDELEETELEGGSDEKPPPAAAAASTKPDAFAVCSKCTHLGWCHNDGPCSVTVSQDAQGEAVKCGCETFG